MRVHHIALRTRDLEGLERFYVDVLGLVMKRRQQGRSVWLDASGVIVMLELATADEPRVSPGTMELVAFAVEPAERPAALRRLADAEVDVEARTEHTVYFRDPDGRRVALSTYVF